MNNSINEAVRAYTWDEMDNLCHKLADQIIASSFHPEIIVGIVRGGCFPSLLLSHRFHTRELYTINITTTVDDSVRAPKSTPVIHSVSGLPSLYSKRVLLVDDVTNSGATLMIAKRAIEDLIPGILKIACPIWDTISDSEQEQNICMADFFVDKIYAWAKFPWEHS
jgi:hypoxanthine phosphoribosyltransferase